MMSVGTAVSFKHLRKVVLDEGLVQSVKFVKEWTWVWVMLCWRLMSVFVARTLQDHI